MKITAVETFRRPIRLRTPFKLAFTTLYEVETIIVKVSTDTGLVGYGEASPLVQVTGENIDTEMVALRQLGTVLSGANPCALEQVHARMDTAMRGHTAAKAGIDIACYDILGQQAQLPLYQLLGGMRDTINTDYTLGIAQPAAMVMEARQMVAAGFTALKVKVGLNDADDVTVINQLNQAVGDKVHVRVDANQAWTVKQTVRMARQFGDAVQTIEQPMPAERMDDAPLVRRAITQELMLDESVHDVHDAQRAVAMAGADVINIKLQKSGGIFGATQINTVAESAGVRCMLGCMTETRLGIAAAAHFVAAHANVVYADLDSFILLEETDWLSGGFTNDGGQIKLSDRPGLGVDCHL